MKLSFEQSLLGLLRLSLGWIFLWAFIDKVLGLGFATEPGKALIDGVPPTLGYLTFATHGPLAPLFKLLAGNILVDWLFMTGLLFIGLALILGIGVRIAGYAGALMMALMFLAASLPPEHNPVLDEHIVYMLVLVLFTQLPVGNYLGLGKWWSQVPVVKQRSWLK